MSFHRLGISHFPALGRPALSPTTSTFSDSITQEDVNEDNKDVLLDRLNDLVLRLSKEDSLVDTAVTAIHSKVEAIEQIIRSGRRKKIEEVGARENDSYWGSLSPTRSISLRLPSSAKNTPRHSRQATQLDPSPQMNPTQATEIAKAAEELVSQLTHAVVELQSRKEESDRIHDLLFIRAEKAAERILLLEYRIAEMQDDCETNHSELEFLRIQLKALESQCSPYIPQNEDQELSESIMQWKIDWEDINRKTKARRKNGHSSSSPSDTKGSGVNSPPLQHDFSRVSIQDAA